MSSSLSRIPPGVQYFFDEEARIRRCVEREVTRVFEGWSYSEIILPIFDYADLFSLGMGKDQAEMTYRFTGRDGKLLALRPEMTSLVARTVATRFQSRERPIRLCYSGEVFRWDEPRAGRQYEFHQIGLEHIGSDRREADTEVLVIAIEALKNIGLEEFKITLGHVDLFNGIADQLGLDPARIQILQSVIDRKQIAELKELLSSYADESTRTKICELVSLTGNAEILSGARQFISNPRSAAALDEIDRVYAIAKALDLDSFLEIDLGEVGGLDYYSGLTFKIFAPRLGAALGRGGRYDHLLEKFGRAECAVGFSLCLDWLVELVEPGLRVRTQNGQPERVDSEDTIAAFKQAVRLRRDGKTIEVV
jgi:ATP phosphoribosyltransferase regulatory subunit